MKLISDAEAEALADLEARHARERTRLGVDQMNARRTMLDRQRREMAAAMGADVAELVDQVAGNTESSSTPVVPRSSVGKRRHR